MTKKDFLPNLRTNILGLFTLHGFGFLITFASISYLTNIFGVSGWGKIVFVQLVLNYVCWITNWGFYLGGTKTIASFRGKPGEINNFLSNGLGAQLFLTVFAIFVLSLFVLFIDILRADKVIYFSGLLVVIGNLLMPLWFLNGLEKIIESSVIQLTVKSLSLIFYFLFIKNQSQIYLYFLINGSLMIFVGVLLLIWINFGIGCKIKRPHIPCVLKIIKDNTSLFMSTIVANINTSIIPFSIGIIVGEQSLGYFNIADRMRTAAVQVLHPISHALFPRMGYLMANARSEAKKLAIKSGFILGCLSLLLSFLLLIFSQDIVFFIAGEKFSGSILILQIIAFSPFLTTLYAFFVYQLAIPAGLNSIYLLSVMMMSALNGIAIVPALYHFGLMGAAILVILIEFCGLALLVYLTLLKKSIFTFDTVK